MCQIYMVTSITENFFSSNSLGPLRRVYAVCGLFVAALFDSKGTSFLNIVFTVNAYVGRIL